MNVLLIDDDDDDVELFRDAAFKLSPQINCWSAKDGKDGLRMLSHELVVLPDIIFLDINMPVMDGRECLSRIKSNPRLKSIPVFMYSTTSNLREIGALKKMGAKDFVIKPNDFESLVRLLKSIFLRSWNPTPSAVR